MLLSNLLTLHCRGTCDGSNSRFGSTGSNFQPGELDVVFTRTSELGEILVTLIYMDGPKAHRFN